MAKVEDSVGSQALKASMISSDKANRAAVGKLHSVISSRSSKSSSAEVEDSKEDKEDLKLLSQEEKTLC